MTTQALRRWLAAILLLVATGCSQPVSGNPIPGDPPRAVTEGSRTAESEEPEEPEEQGATLDPLVGTWKGEYTCLQGVTGLDLTVTPVDEQTVRAVFAFYPTQENPDALEGSYQLLGSYRGDRLVFRQEKWLKQPENYVMVDLEVTSPVEPDMDILSGNVLSPDCKGFSVRRAD